MNRNKLDFNDIIRRQGGPSQDKTRIPTEFHQCVVFYSRPVLEELESLQELNPIIAAVTGIQKKLKNQRFIFPFYSKEIFGSPQEAQMFLPNFIRRLLNEGKLPPEAVNEDKSVNDDILRAGVAPLAVTMIEEEKPEFTYQGADPEVSAPVVF